MTTPERARKETMAEVQRILSRARPEQLHRLLADIRGAETITDRDENIPQRRSA